MSEQRAAYRLARAVKLTSSSPLEDELDRQMTLAALPAWEAEYRFCPRRKWRADRAWPHHRLLVEVEGGVWSGGRHTRGAGYEADCEKYNEAAILGYRVIRVTGAMVRDGRALDIIMRALGAS